MKKTTSTLSNEESILNPSDDKQNSKLGFDLANENICVEIFVAAETFCVENPFKSLNLITLNELSSFTNRNIHFYKNFRVKTQYKSL